MTHASPVVIGLDYLPMPAREMIAAIIHDQYTDLAASYTRRQIEHARDLCRRDTGAYPWQTWSRSDPQGRGTARSTYRVLDRVVVQDWITRRRDAATRAP